MGINVIGQCATINVVTFELLSGISCSTIIAKKYYTNLRSIDKAKLFCFISFYLLKEGRIKIKFIIEK